jgi:hypothetical protein
MVRTRPPTDIRRTPPYSQRPHPPIKVNQTSPESVPHMKRYRQPFTHFILFYAGVFSVASIIGLIQELIGGGANLLLLVLCVPAALYMTFLGLYGLSHWVEVSDSTIRIRNWRKIEEASWSDFKSIGYSRRGLTLSTETKTLEVSRWLRRYLELHEHILQHLPKGVAPEVPSTWKAELTGGLRVVAHLNFWVLLGAPSAGVAVGLITHGPGGLVLAAVSSFVAFAIAKWVSFPVVSYNQAGTALHVERAVGSLDLDVTDIDSLTLYEANQSPWSLHNGFRLGYGSAELRARNRSIWIENPLCPEVLYHWLLREGFSVTATSRGYYRKLVRGTAAAPAGVH